MKEVSKVNDLSHYFFVLLVALSFIAGQSKECLGRPIIPSLE
jgi:hypothetical protein